MPDTGTRTMNSVLKWTIKYYNTKKSEVFKNDDMELYIYKVISEHQNWLFAIPK